MEWLKDHMTCRPDPRVPQELRDASHRLNSETHAVHATAVNAAGGPMNFERLVREMRDDQ